MVMQFAAHVDVIVLAFNASLSVLPVTHFHIIIVFVCYAWRYLIQCCLIHAMLDVSVSW